MALRRTIQFRSAALASWRSQRAAATAAAASATSAEHQQQQHQQLKFSKAKSLGIPPGSPLRYVEQQPSGFKGVMLRVLGFYSAESKRIRGAKLLYERIKIHVDESPTLYSSFGLEKNFRTTHAMLLLHVWMVLVRLRAEDKGKNIGQTMYEVFNMDLEKRVYDEGITYTILLKKWMKELEKNFYGAAKAYDNAMIANDNEDLARALWRNVFAEDDSPFPSDHSRVKVQGLANYVRWELASLSLTESEDFVAGNISFSDGLSFQ